MPKRKFIGPSERLRILKEQEAAGLRPPDPWVARKFAIGMVVGIVGYVYYVFVVRICVKMVRGRERRLGSKGTGIALLTIFHILLLLFVWSYIKVISTPPGNARDHIAQTPRPVDPSRSHPATPHAKNSTQQPALAAIQPSPHPPASAQAEDTLAGPRFEDLESRPFPSTQVSVPQARESSSSSPEHSHEMEETKRPAPILTLDGGNVDRSAIPPPPPSTNLERRSPIPIKAEPKNGDPRLVVTRYTWPALAPWNRYCSKCGIVKPYRAHHDRHTGTCVLKYDHFCPWIGHCVGARNHKFFLNFCAWAAVFCSFVFLSTLLLVAIPYHKSIPSNTSRRVDPQTIVIIGLGFVFGLFTVGLTITHAWMIGHNMSTVEHIGIANMKEREDRKIVEVFGLIGKWKEKREVRTQWTEQMGHLYTTGNIWFVEGGRRENWKRVMGRKWWMWIFPVNPERLDDGLHYEVNQRFDELGRLKRREQWAEHLR
ncbi:zf-DHHC-domain-containing protein [Atractiella rhizophila]|nr:zf-DHHC-domain-containing protein [Atractiella rhizophila]